MKFIAARDLRIRPRKVFRDLKEAEQLVLTSKGLPVAMMVPVTPDNVEETARTFRRAQALEAVSAIRERWARSGRRLTMRQIDRIIRDTRKGNKA